MKKQVSHENNARLMIWSESVLLSNSRKRIRQEKKIYFSNMTSCINSERREKINQELMRDDQNLPSKNSTFVKEEIFYKGKAKYLQRPGSGTIARESLAK